MKTSTKGAAAPEKKAAPVAAEPKTGSAVAVVPPKSNLPASMNDAFGEHAGKGMENVGARDLLIPRIAILQQLSPQVNPKKAEFIEGAKIGDICDLAMGKIIASPLVFLPVQYRKEWLEWAPRASGKGLIAIHPDASILDKTTRNNRNQSVLANGNLIAETSQFFGLNLSDGGSRCFLPMASTQLKKAKKWMTLATGERLTRSDSSEFMPPLWFRTYKLSPVEENNASGDWVGWRVERDLNLVEFCEANKINFTTIKQTCIDFAEVVTSGAARGDLSGVEDDGAAEGPAAGNEGAM